MDNTLHNSAAKECLYSSATDDINDAQAIIFISIVANQAAEIKCDLVG